MKNTFDYSISKFDKFINEFDNRVDDIAHKLTLEFKGINDKLYVQRGNTRQPSLEICIEGTTYSRTLLTIDRTYKVKPIRSLVGYPKITELDFGDIYEDVQLNDCNDDIVLIKRMFEKYHSYGRLFKRIKKELENA
jgi:hypothetical protein